LCTDDSYQDTSDVRRPIARDAGTPPVPSASRSAPSRSDLTGSRSILASSDASSDRSSAGLPIRDITAPNFRRHGHVMSDSAMSHAMTTAHENACSYAAIDSTIVTVALARHSHRTTPNPIGGDAAHAASAPVRLT